MSDYPYRSEPESRLSRVLLAVGGGFVMLGTGAVVVILFLLVNGGLTYRKDCATNRGTVKKSWSYQWFAPIPYLLAPSEEGCQVHTGTRVLLSSIGLWPIGKESAGSIALSTASDAGTAYYASIYGVLSEIDKATAKKSAAAYMSALADAQVTLASQTPPDYLVEDHGRLIDLFDRIVMDARAAKNALDAGDQTAYTKASKDYATDTQAFFVRADKIRLAVIAHRGG